MSHQKVSAAVPSGGNTTTGRQKIGTTSTYQSVFKKAKRSSDSVTNSPPSLETTIDDLPDFVLVEILCRLLYNVKLVFQCKCVSRRWFALISNSYFITRFLCQHYRQQKSFATTDYVMVPYKDNKIVPLTSSSILPSSLSLNFLPCFESPNQDNEPIVEAIFDDLVLCCATKNYQYYYYICNPLTKHWVALPPVRQVFELKVPVGFICEPYCDHGREEQNSARSSSSSSIMKLNTGYRCRVVRILPNSICHPELGFYVQIFSSETGEWREYRLPNRIKKFGWFIAWRPGVACNGKLYWYNDGGFTFELDSFNISTSGFPSGAIIDSCRFTKTPRKCFHLGVCQGRLRMYPFSIMETVSIWELKENSGNLEWCLIFDRIPMLDMVSKDPKITKEKSGKLDVLGFHPSNEDVVYLKFPEHIIMCNLRKKTLEKSPVDPHTNIQFDFSCNIDEETFSFGRRTNIHPYVLPWWPTPVPRINQPKERQIKVLKQFDIFLPSESFLIVSSKTS
ncbi:putative F-box domain-containing protein [Rosa chinensis]|uniref:Putative F-box domain-containing protein n=1 Tax=Rosa chinensis TaxID=74649 RepID=A0A2P6R5M6_ROSCH|nr:putative F-box domain-containing protein [Rosa chinensis]